MLQLQLLQGVGSIQPILDWQTFALSWQASRPTAAQWLA